MKAKTIAQAELFSKTGKKQAQYLPSINNKVLEKEALKSGKIIDIENKGSKYFLYDAGKPVGFDLGIETSGIRAELTTTGIYHGHPIAGNQLRDYLKN